MAESDTRRHIVQWLRSLDAMAVENSCLPGTPDVEYIGGWIECKYLPSWPKVSDNKPIRLRHSLTLQQRIWLFRRIRLGGRAYVVLQVGREWLLFRGDIAAKYLEHVSKPELLALALRYWSNRPTAEEFKGAVSAI